MEECINQVFNNFNQQESVPQTPLHIIPFLEFKLLP